MGVPVRERAAPEGHALRRARPGRSEVDRRAADRLHAAAPDPDQPADRGHAARHAAVPAVGGGAGHPAVAAAGAPSPRKTAKRSSTRRATVSITILTFPTSTPRSSTARPAARCRRHRRSTHAPRILLLYGSLRERSYSRLLTVEAARLLQAMGAEMRIFDPARPAAARRRARETIPRCRSCATWRTGPKAWSGPRPSATAR